MPCDGLKMTEVNFSYIFAIFYHSYNHIAHSPVPFGFCQFWHDESRNILMLWYLAQYPNLYIRWLMLMKEFLVFLVKDFCSISAYSHMKWIPEDWKFSRKVGFQIAGPRRQWFVFVMVMVIRAHFSLKACGTLVNYLDRHFFWRNI